MTKQQSKRRRKRYAPASAYAVDVRPSGVLGVLSSRRTMGVVFVGMALAIAAGTAGSALFGTGVFGGGDDNPQGFTVQGDEGTGTPDAGPTREVRRYDGPPAMTIDTTKRYVATISTTKGDIEVELSPQEAPETVNNFVFLARDGFYDGLAFHFADPSFSVNSGDPGCTPSEIGSSLCRGAGDPGYELSEDVQGEFAPGTIGMANASQFFIALSESSEFDEFTPIGRITSGLDVARQIQRGDAIESVEIQES
jgi:cyclophilin family peptidyl-prolyl cis-trans isomerase